MIDTVFSSAKTGDRYGHYRVGGIKVYSKLEMIDLLHRFPADWSWKYHDEFFGSYDWSKEPEEYLAELYKKRALQLREDYDYLVLYYSGGHDSANILYAFVENGIPLDEICFFRSRHDRESFSYQEFSQFTESKLACIKEKYPEITIRIWDYADYFLDWEKHISSLGYGSNLLEMFGNMLSVNRLAVDFAVDQVPEWRAILDSGKTLGFLRGIEKPMMRYIDGQWIFNFHDGLTQACVTPLRQIVDSGNMGTVEFFYWAPEHECAQIIIKQCHAVKNKYDLQAKHDFSKIPGAKTFKPNYGWEINTMDCGFVETIYPRLYMHGEQYYMIKNPRHVFGNRDMWFFNSNHDMAVRHRDVYMSTHSSMYSHRREWFNNGRDVFDGIRNCISPDYVIG